MDYEEPQDLSMSVIRRMPTYFVILEDLKRRRISRVSSKELSEMTGFTASQIRQDLNKYGGFGQQGYGYNVTALYDCVKEILDLNREKTMILTGVGNIGQAIASYPDFVLSGFKFIGLFDRNPKVVGLNINGIEVMDISKLDTFVEKNNVDVGVIAVSKSGAREVGRMYEKAGIKAIWNFAPIVLDVSPDVIVENVRMSESLYTLSYLLKGQREGLFSPRREVKKAKTMVLDKETGVMRPAKKRGRPRKSK